MWGGDGAGRFKWTLISTFWLAARVWALEALSYREEEPCETAWGIVIVNLLFSSAFLHPTCLIQSLTYLFLFTSLLSRICDLPPSLWRWPEGKQRGALFVLGLNRWSPLWKTNIPEWKAGLPWIVQHNMVFANTQKEHSFILLQKLQEINCNCYWYFLSIRLSSLQPNILYWPSCVSLGAEKGWYIVVLTLSLGKRILIINNLVIIFQSQCSRSIMLKCLGIKKQMAPPSGLLPLTFGQLPLCILWGVSYSTFQMNNVGACR